MSKLDEKLTTYTATLEKLGHKVDAPLLKAVTKACGPSIYNKDAETVSSSSSDELATVKKNFLGKKLGMTDDAKCDAAIAKVVEEMGASNRNKYRAVFYYLLTKNAKKASVFK